jgi:hypothetical protein
VRISVFPDLRALRRRSFDRTEFQEPFVPSNATHLPPIQSGSQVLFRGVLSILALTHLSDKGVQYLNRDFKERVVGLDGIRAARKYSTFNMKSIFELKAEQKQLPKAEQFKVKVLIQGFMSSAASFMRCKLSMSIQLHLELTHLQLILLRMGYCSTRQMLQRPGDGNFLTLSSLLLK